MKMDIHYEIYFFDFFGTIMNRRCSADDIKRIWSFRMSLFLKKRLSSEEIYKLRIAAENFICKRENNYEFQYIDMIEEIYRRISSLKRINTDVISKRDFIQLSLQLEILVETEMQVVNDKVINSIRNLKRLQKKIYILSDFYLGKEYILRFLDSKDITDIADEIIVSCDYGKNKSTGNLYKTILSEMSLNPEVCCMIGDNYRSDYLNAKKNGIAAMRIFNNKHNKTVDIKRCLCKTKEKEKKHGKSYANYHFLLYKFTEELYFSLSRQGHKTVFFLAREGEFLKALFDLYCRKINKKFGLPIIESKYLYVSRQATYSASLCDLKEERFDTLFLQYPNLSLKAFLKNIGIDEQGRELLQKHFDLDFDEVILNLRESDLFTKLMKNDVFHELYGYTLEKRKSGLVKYLQQEGFFDTSSVAIVDVGWKGSIQDNLSKVVQNRVFIDGYYCGLKNNAICMENSKKTGLVFTEYPYKSDHYDVWSFDYNFMERLLTASHPSTSGYNYIENRITPVFNDFGSEEENYKMIRPIQEQIAFHFEQYISVIYDLPVLSNELDAILRNFHLDCCCNIYKSNMVLQGKLLSGQVENFGYQLQGKEHLKETFTLKNILKKIIEKRYLLRNTTLITHVLVGKKLYIFSVIISRIAGLRLRRS